MSEEPRSEPLGELDDRALLAAHVAGREGAFGELFGRHRDRLWAVALRTTGHPEDAADGLQDGMVAAFVLGDRGVVVRVTGPADGDPDSDQAVSRMLDSISRSEQAAA